MQIIKDTPRKILRYLMFCKKNKVKLDRPIVSKKADVSIISYYESRDNFPGWKYFDVTWDIGMSDDIVARATRVNKWFLFKHSKIKIVLRPANYWDKEAERRKISKEMLITQECVMRGIDRKQFNQLFFPKS